jgi:ABC-2 type transport system ATP-binding protein
MSEVLAERAAAGTAVVFSSHQLDLVEDVCEDVIIISRGRVVAEGPIAELKARAHRRHLEVEVSGAGGGWLPPDGHTVLEHEGDRHKLLVDEDTDLSVLLAAARAAGEVRRFAYGPPRLSELFMQAVTAPQHEGDAMAGEPAGVEVTR